MEPTAGARADMTVVTDFTQRVPTDGAAATQRTDVYLGYDARNLYAVFVAFDTEPENVRANLASRENIDNDDRVGILIDTFNDQRAAYGFRSSPLGVQWDGRWSEASRGASYDTAYEAVWYTDAQRTDFGYVVLMTIPFRTMRFPEDSEQQWRIQFERLIPRLSEESYWPAYSQSIDGRLNQAATLTGVRDVSPGRNIQVIPFAFVRSYDVLDPSLAGGPGFTEDTEDDLGLDAKFVLRDSLVLDLTYNPDFSQVESDQPQVTVNERYEVQYPERRPFFLENADYFTTETPLVFTRRIVDPQAGLKFTGRQGPWGIGSMLIDDEAPGADLPPGDPLQGEAADIDILRVFRDIGEQSRVGLLYTNREFGAEYNRVAAADTRVRLTDNWSTELLLVNTDTRLPSGETVAGRQTNWRFDRNGRHALAHIHWTQQSDEFRAQLGILGRNYQPDTRGPHGNVQYRFWPTDAAIDSWGPRVGFAYQEDQTGMRTYANLAAAHGAHVVRRQLARGRLQQDARTAAAEGLRRPHEHPRLRTTRLVDGDGHLCVHEVRLQLAVECWHDDQLRAAGRRGARARRWVQRPSELSVAADGATPRRHELPRDGAGRSRRRWADFRQQHPAHPLELSVHEGVVAALHCTARGNASVATHEPR